MHLEPGHYTKLNGKESFQEELNFAKTFSALVFSFNWSHHCYLAYSLAHPILATVSSPHSMVISFFLDRRSCLPSIPKNPQVISGSWWPTIEFLERIQKSNMILYSVHENTKQRNFIRISRLIFLVKSFSIFSIYIQFIYLEYVSQLKPCHSEVKITSYS